MGVAAIHAASAPNCLSVKRMINKLIAPALVLLLGATYTLCAFAQVKPEVLVEQRQGAMRLQGKYLYALLPMAQGKIPYDAGVVARNAGYLDVLTVMAWDGFDPATQSEKSRALPEIYKDSAGFKTAEDKLHTEMAKFVATVKTGNEANIKTGIVDLNKACNSCHENFRQKR